MPVPVTVVIATRDRRPGLLQTLGRLTALDERPPVVVVDNGSSDGTPAAVRAAHPTYGGWSWARTKPARNEGVAAATTPYVAFADDDSWWAPGALTRAARAFDAHPAWRSAARTLAGRRAPRPHERGDGRSPLPPPGRRAVATRRFSPSWPVGRWSRTPSSPSAGSATSCSSWARNRWLPSTSPAGWLAYLDDVVAHHHPSSDRSLGRRALIVRNDLLYDVDAPTTRVALGRTAHVVAAARDPAHRMALQQLPARFARALAHRRSCPRRSSARFARWRPHAAQDVYGPPSWRARTGAGGRPR